MSTEKSASNVKIFGLIGESIRSLLRGTPKPLAPALLLAMGGFLAADLLAFVLRDISVIIKAVVMVSTAWATVYLMRMSGTAGESISIKDLFRELRSKLPRTLGTFLAVAVRFLGPGVLVVAVYVVVFMSKSRELAAIFLPVAIVFGTWWSIFLFVHYIFSIYLIFDSGLKPWNIPSRSSELTNGHGWKIFFTMIVSGILVGIAMTPLFLLYPRMLDADRISALANFTVGVFSFGYPSIFVLLYYIVFAFAVVFQTVVFMKLYDKITQSIKQNEQDNILS